MKRFRFADFSLIPAVLAALALVSCADSRRTASRAESGTVVLRLAESMSEEHPSAQAAERLAALVKERSRGRISIRVYYGGALGTPRQVIDQVQFGGIAMARVSALDLAEVVLPLRAYLSPRSFPDAEALMARLSERREDIAGDCLKERLVPMVFYYPDIRCFYSDSATFRGIDDFSKLRVGISDSEVLRNAVAALGAAPVVQASADTYKSLRAGYIQARESSFSELVLNGDYPFTTALAMTRYLASPDVIVMSPEILNGISDAERRMIEDCAQETYQYQKDLMDKFHIRWITRMREDRKDVFWEDAAFAAEIAEAFGRTERSRADKP